MDVFAESMQFEKSNSYPSNVIGSEAQRRSYIHTATECHASFTALTAYYFPPHLALLAAHFTSGQQQKVPQPTR